MLKSLRRLLACSLVALGLPALAQAQMELPDGEGKQLIDAACVACHVTDLIPQSVGRTNEQWRHLMSKMIDLPEPLGSQIAHYLSTNFPYDSESARLPTLVAGDTKVTFHEWTVPTLGQRPPREPGSGDCRGIPGIDRSRALAGTRADRGTPRPRPRRSAPGSGPSR